MNFEKKATRKIVQYSPTSSEEKFEFKEAKKITPENSEIENGYSIPNINKKKQIKNSKFFQGNKIKVGI